MEVKVMTLICQNIFESTMVESKVLFDNTYVTNMNSTNANFVCFKFNRLEKERVEWPKI